ncbi:ATP-binding protein [Paenibacillus filicis]|uniref:histidine kinase n=1 Tax=Paenibacillus filicis TaxID=669464 RepID=A0ABU9DNR9_9BACL
MKRTYLGKWIGIALIFTLTLSLFIAVQTLTAPNRDAPSTSRGVLDLTGWDFERQGLVRLDGEWEFYAGELLTPADFREGERHERAYAAVPGTWRGKTFEGGIDRRGFGTYRLKVKLGQTDEVLGLKVRSIRMSHRLFINGKLMGESGIPAADLEHHQPGNTPYTTFFHTDASELEIVIQASNYVFVTGGIVNSLQFGLHQDLAVQDGIQIGSDIALVLILGIFGAYHLSFYFMGRREKTYVLSGLYLFIILLGSLLYGEKLLQRIFPALPFDVAYKLLDLSQFGSAFVIILFFNSINARLLPQRAVAWLTAPLVLYIASVIALPYRIHTEMKYFFFLYAGILFFYILSRLLYLYGQERKHTSDRYELLLFIGGLVSLMLYLVDGTLYTENAVPTDLAGKLGLICFIICMNILLAVRFSNAYEKTELLTHKLMVSNQRKDEFLMNTSHELKTPLHGILNMASHLLEDEEKSLTAQQKQHLWLIKDTSMKLSMLIHDLIDVSSLKHGELRLYPTVVHLRMVVKIVIEILQFELAGKAVRLSNEVDPAIWVLADENRLRQVLYNLVHNAIKYTQQGTITVRSSLDQEAAVISVEDTGRGIAPDKHAAVFEYFERLEESLPQDGYPGMGVGLYISRQLVERMDGAIRIDWSEPGRGTRVVFSLPAREPAGAYLETASAEEEPQRVEGPDGPLEILDQHEHTILLVDDEPSNIRMLLNILKRQPYNVKTAFSAQEALVKMKEQPPVDLVLLDVMMPEISGVELCRMLREEHSILDLPILFATVKDAPSDIALGFRAGANDYVTKPFEGETLIARIQTLLAMKTSIQEAIRNEHAFHQAQIKPHFLYNALSSVISFCYTDGEKAAYLLTMLSHYLRYILDMDRSSLFVPLYRELELIQVYVEIEKARFGERFDFVCEVDPALSGLMIPSLSIQPFVENAIRHGLFEKEGTGTVSLSIEAGDGFITVSIEDDGVGMPEEVLRRILHESGQGGGIGIHNIRRRLATIPQAALTMHTQLEIGTSVRIDLPMTHRGVEGNEEDWEKPL